MTEQIQIYINKFKSFGEVSIADEEWTPEFEQSFRAKLKEQGVGEIRIYKTLQQPDRKLICGVFHHPSMPIEQLYQEGSGFIRVMPVLGMIFLYFLCVALFALLGNDLLSIAFLILMPFSFGALVEYISLLKKPHSIGQSFILQLWVLAFVLFAGLIVLREGIICLIMAAPIYLLCAFLGAIVMRLICYKLWKPYNQLYSIALLPLLGLLLLPDVSQYHNGQTQQEIVVNAPIQTVFASINNIQQIQPEEIKYSPIFTMGFPKPISGMTEQTDQGLIRQIYWQRGIHFQEKISQSNAPHQLAWTYVFTPQSFPKGSLDDHLEMGGKYFNLLTTDYKLEAISPTQTKMILTIDYRLSTEVNWYADVWTGYVLNEFSDVVLNIYKRRLEQGNA